MGCGANIIQREVGFCIRTDPSRPYLVSFIRNMIELILANSMQHVMLDFRFIWSESISVPEEHALISKDTE